MATTKTRERFWDQVQRGAPGECWLWTGKKIRGGYGDHVASVDGRWKHTIAHRFAWAEANGPIPVGLLVLHRCDVPACVNPAHLFLGTQQDNMNDQAAKGRRPPAEGERNKHARLTEEQVREIRRLVNEEGAKRTDVGARFGVDRSWVSLIASGRAWSHVALTSPPVPGKRGRPRKVA